MSHYSEKNYTQDRDKKFKAPQAYRTSVTHGYVMEDTYLHDVEQLINEFELTVRSF